MMEGHQQEYLQYSNQIQLPLHCIDHFTGDQSSGHVVENLLLVGNINSLACSNHLLGLSRRALVGRAAVVSREISTKRPGYTQTLFLRNFSKQSRILILWVNLFCIVEILLKASKLRPLTM